MKNVLTIVLGATAAAVAVAQPTIGPASYGAIGDTLFFQAVIFSSVSPGASGANVTWDFSGAVDDGNPSIGPYLSPTATPYASDFPEATLATQSLTSDAYAYYKVTSAKAELLGTKSSIYSIIFDDPETLNEFPSTFNTTHSDYFHANGVTSGSFERMGTNLVTADAYGTLITPAGTFPNCLRFHYTQDFMDTFPILEVASYYTSNAYSWIAPSYPGTLMSISTLTTTIPGFPPYDMDFAGYNSSPKPITGINSVSRLRFVAAPNPAADFVLLQWPADAEAERIQVWNALGDMVISESVQGTDNVEIDIRRLPAGCYHVVLQANTESRSLRLVKAG